METPTDSHQPSVLFDETGQAPAISEHLLLLGTALLGLLVWVSNSVFWWTHLEGDAPLYPIITLEVLKGHHYLMTEGQAHGGTLLIYVRAALFWLFGVSHFLGFFVNGLFATAGAVLWARFAKRQWGLKAGVVMGLLGAVATERFARSACTDYFVFTLFSSGLMLNFAEAESRQLVVRRKAALLAGLLIGFSWYICRFSALYLVAAMLFYLSAIEPTRRRLWVPSWRELTSTNLDRTLLYIIPSGFALSVLAFFTDDRFLGVNAESNLKVFIALSLLVWFRHRWRCVFSSFVNILLVGAGIGIGLIPEFCFKAFVGTKDRVTGLVRWSDIHAYSSEILPRIGENFSFYHQRSLGYVAAACGVALLALGLGQKRHWLVVAPVLLCLGAWLTIHTYMHLPSQYFFPVFFPLYLSAAFAVAKSRFPKTALALTTVLFGIGALDIATNAFVPNAIRESGVIESLDAWRAQYHLGTEGFGQMTSNYDIMWASKGNYFLPQFDLDSRFLERQAQVHQLERVLFVYSDTDRYALQLPPGYNVLDHKELPHGFKIFVLEKNHGT